MSDCTHEEHVGLDNLIRCRKCGVILPEIVLASVQSAIRARRIQDEIASAGEYQATGMDGDFVVYSDGKGIEIAIKKIAERRFDVVKRVKNAQ